MSKVIDGHKLDHLTAKLLGEDSNGLEFGSPDFIKERLCCTRRSNIYFIYGEGGINTRYAKHKGGSWEYGDDYYVISEESAKKWILEHFGEDKIKEIWAEVPPDQKIPISAKLTKKAYDKLAAIAAETNQNYGEIISSLLLGNDVII